METVINTNITSLYPHDTETGPSAVLYNKRKILKWDHLFKSCV